MRVNLLPVLAVVVFLAPSMGFSQALPLEVRKRIYESVVLLLIEEDEGWSRGSGTIVSPDGYILTNHHVAETKSGSIASQINVLFTNPDAPDVDPEYRYQAVVVEFDEHFDLALLRIVSDSQGNPVQYPLNLTYSAVGDSNALLPGDSITVVGYPGISGRTITFTSGLMSGFVANDFNTGGREWVKTDAKISSGNSGGAAFNTAGDLVAIPTLIRRGENVFQEYLRPTHLALPLLELHIAGFPEALNPDASDRVGVAPPEEPEPEANPPAAAAAPAPPPEPATGPPETRVPAEDFVQVGVLTQSSDRDASGRHEESFDIIVEEFAALQIDARSSEFDIAVRLYDPQGQLVLNVDDTPGQGRNVVESVTAQRPGAYRLVVTSSYPKELGEYQVEVRGAVSGQ